MPELTLRELKDERDRLNSELDKYLMLAAQECPAGRHVTWLADTEYNHACPWCRAETAEGRLDDIRQWCHDWSADQWVARAILDRIGWPEQEVTHD